MRERGFTLIELIVVIVILSVMLAMTGITVMRNPEDELRDEAQRLALLLQAARLEAVMQGRLFAATLESSGYRFQAIQEGRLADLAGDDVLRPRELPPEITIKEVSIDGARAEARARIVFLPSGDLQNFVVTLARDKLLWEVRTSADGQIEARSPASEPRAVRHAARFHAA